MCARQTLIPAAGVVLFCLTLLYMGLESPAENDAEARLLMALSASLPRGSAQQEVDAGAGGDLAPERAPASFTIGAIRGIAAPEPRHAPAPHKPIARAPRTPAKPVAVPAAMQPRTREITALVTGYCPCRRCCGRFANGRTSTRTSAWDRGVAADPSVIPYRSTVEIPGYGTATVDDTGIAMRRSWAYRGRVHLDVRFDYHYQARRWGTRILKIRVTPPEGRQLGF